MAQYIANHLRAERGKAWRGSAGQPDRFAACARILRIQPVDCFAAARTSDTKLYAKYFNEMLLRGVYLAPSQFEAMFVSSAHTQNDLAFTVQAADRVLLRSHRGFKAPVRKDVPTLRLQRGVSWPAHSISSARGWARRTG